MVWRTKGVFRKVVEPFGFLMNYVEILDCEEILPSAKVTVWVTKETVPPPSIVAVLVGLEVLVQVEVLPSSRTKTYADMVNASRWVSVGGGLGNGVTGPTAGISSAPPVVESEQGDGSGSLPVSLQTGSRFEVLADVASSGDHPGCQLAINGGGSVPGSDDLSTGHIAGSSLKRKVACPPVSVGGRMGSVRGRLGLFRASTVAGGQGDGQRDDRRRDVSVYFKRQVVGLLKSHASRSWGRKVVGRGSKPIKPTSSASYRRDPSYPKGQDPTRDHETTFSHGEHQDDGLAVSEEKEVPPNAQPSDLVLVPSSEGAVDLLLSGSQTPKEVSLSVVVEPSEAEFLGSLGCEKAKQIGVIFHNEEKGSSSSPSYINLSRNLTRTVHVATSRILVDTLGFALEETKMEVFSSSDLLLISGNRIGAFEAKASVGASGGIVLAWNEKSFKKIDLKVLNFSISLLMEDTRTHWRWIWTGVYGPNADDRREEMWQELSDVKSEWNHPWCLMGDFNITRFTKDRNREGVITRHMARFSEWVADEGLSDVPLSNQCYTWSNLHERPSCALLDWVFLDTNWEDRFPSCHLRGIPRTTSDHSPLIFDRGSVPFQSFYFKFENWWLQCDNFREMVVTN
ncbi:hypothetical protein QJS10_CPA09g00935 [Acorus calamus]|uniref:Endonuclease/exonuclease/phosphatase domain-containing protein n=1 Tax=Acorus calamus TaxID=4465 RepID=A0AAV9E6R7_ACOCL|nr:hypothetical protein QJS10_CPA09g00935 [Acorus calamus]